LKGYHGEEQDKTLSQCDIMEELAESRMCYHKGEGEISTKLLTKWSSNETKNREKPAAI
jgi:hypothetical protein